MFLVLIVVFTSVSRGMFLVLIVVSTSVSRGMFLVLTFNSYLYLS